jgi:hypothetical protein
VENSWAVCNCVAVRNGNLVRRPSPPPCAQSLAVCHPAIRFENAVYAGNMLGVSSLAAVSLANLTGNLTGLSLILGLCSAVDTLAPQVPVEHRSLLCRCRYCCHHRCRCRCHCHLTSVHAGDGRAQLCGSGPARAAQRRTVAVHVPLCVAAVVAHGPAAAAAGPASGDLRSLRAGARPSRPPACARPSVLTVNCLSSSRSTAWASPPS